MRNNRGMTLAEVLIGAFIFSIVSMIFTTGLFMTINLINAANEKKVLERAAEEIILAENADGIDYLADSRLDLIEYPAVVSIKIKLPDGTPLESEIYGTILNARVTEGFRGGDVELFDFKFEDLY